MEDFEFDDSLLRIKNLNGVWNFKGYEPVGCKELLPCR